MMTTYKTFLAPLTGTEKQIAYAEKLFQAAFEKIAAYIEVNEEDAADALADKASLAELIEDGYFPGKTAEEVTLCDIYKVMLAGYQDMDGVSKADAAACVKFADLIGETSAAKIIDQLKAPAMTLDDYKTWRADVEKQFGTR